MDFLQEDFDNILNIFSAESEEIIQRLNANILNLEKKRREIEAEIAQNPAKNNPGEVLRYPNDKDTINYLFRDAHNLKGAARMVGFNQIQLLAHRLEDILDLANKDVIELNTSYIDILYKAVDFIYFLIQKCVKNKSDFYSEEAEIHLNALDAIINAAESDAPVDLYLEEQDTSGANYKDCYESVNEAFGEIVHTLNSFYNGSTSVLDDLIAGFAKMAAAFAPVGLKNISGETGEILKKLKFIKSATGIVSSPEVIEFYENLKNLLSLLENVPYLGTIVLNELHCPAEERNNPYENVKRNTEAFVKIDNVLEELPKLEYDLSKIDTILSGVQEISSLVNDVELTKIYQKISEVFETIKQQHTPAKNEIMNLLAQCLKSTKEILREKDEITPDDTELLFQHLAIIQHIMGLENKKDILQTVDMKELQPNSQKTQEFFDSFESVSIKTLRVDTQKLDQLVNQMSELIVSRIKTQKHINEVEKIQHELEEWENASQKTCNYMRYYDKKLFSNTNNSKSDELMNFTHQLLGLFQENSSKISNLKNMMTGLYKLIKEDNIKYNLIVDDLELMIKNIRILPLATIFHMFPRMIRDIAKQKEKEIELFISGSETSADKKIIEEIKSPLIHILRNSIDHGIESPEERIRLGKSPSGKMQINAYALSNKIIIEIQDDGRGINIDKIKANALNKKLLSEEELRNMSDEQIMNLIFLPGFSTGESVTDISGRGIGLDIVQTKISQLDGKVKVFSVLGQGAKVIIELPVTMATLKTFVVSVADELFAVPITAINSVTYVNKTDVFIKSGNMSFIYNNQTVPIFHLDKILQLQREKEFDSNRFTVLVIEVENLIAGLIIDKLEGDREILQKKFSPPIFKLKNISGVSTLASGETCFILNVSDLLKTVFNIENTIPAKSRNKIKNMLSIKSNDQYKILVIDDSATTCTLLRNILSSAEYKVKTTYTISSAMNLLAKEYFDMIVTDIKMPTLKDGTEFIKRIKTNDMYHKLPIMVVTSLEAEQFSREISPLGVNDYVLKSDFDQQAFLYKVKKLLHKTQDG